MEHDFINEDGCEWREGREALEAWRAYKHDRAVSLVRQGYSVSWAPDPANWMDVYLPERWYAKESEIRACVKFYRAPSKYGINGGRVSQLFIVESLSSPLDELVGRPSKRLTWYNYDRGPDVDRLSKSARAQLLYEAVLDELN